MFPHRAPRPPMVQSAGKRRSMPTSAPFSPGGIVPAVSVPDLVPDLAVEVLSPGNTPAEMARKRDEYFEAGVRLLWQIDINTQTATAYTGPDQSRTLSRNDALDGGPVLPGFTLNLNELFAELES